MRVLERRLRRLEDQLGPADGKPQLLVVVCKAGWRLALDQDECEQILRESGFLPTGPVAVVNLGKIPEGLNAEETKGFLRENAAEICGHRAGADRLRIPTDIRR
jgi:hypothetical protein